MTCIVLALVLYYIVQRSLLRGHIVEEKPGFIPQEIIEQIKERADIVRILSPFVKLKQAGKNWMAPCPFHQETKPSFTVNPHTQSFYCFGCGAGGNVFSFFMQYDNLTFPDSVRFVADRVGVTIPSRKVSPQAQKEAAKKKTLHEQLFEINRRTSEYFQKLLWEGDGGELGRQYLAARDIDKNTAQTFGIGLSPPPWDRLFAYLSARGYSRELLLKTGLFIQKEGTDRCYDRFRSRIMFPFYDVKGNIVGFAGRTLTDEDAKYINSPETEIYQKRKVLYGLYQGREEIRKARQVIIVEGYFDLIMPFKHGLRNVVATCGTALTEDHLNVLRRYSRTIILLYDGDAAGIQAAFRSLDMILEKDLHVTVCPLKDAKDPDEMVRKKGIQHLRDELEEALEPYTFILTYAAKGKDLKNIDQLVEFLEIISPFLVKIEDPVRRSFLIAQAAEIARIDNELLLQRFRKKIMSGEVIKKTKGQPHNNFTGFEADLVRMLVHFPQKLKYFHEDLSHISLSHSLLNDFLKTILDVWEKENITAPDQWIERWGLLPHKELLMRFAIDSTVEKNIDREIRGSILKCSERTIRKELSAKREKLDTVVDGSDEQIQLLQEVMRLSLDLKEILEKIS